MNTITYLSYSGRYRMICSHIESDFGFNRIYEEKDLKNYYVDKFGKIKIGDEIIVLWTKNEFDHILFLNGKYYCAL